MRAVSHRLLFVGALLVAGLAWASSSGDPSGPVVLWLGLILVGAKLGGELATRLGQPSVLGELLVGVVLGNLDLLGLHLFEPLRSDAFLDMFARVGVILLLFQVGLESTVGQMLQVGRSALLVAVLGVATPMVLGVGAAAWLLPNHSLWVHLFIGATLTATSVGITARVLKDLGRSQAPEARVILGAAVIDDVLGLVILAVVVGLITAADTGVPLSALHVVAPLLKALAFLGGALVLGRWISPRLFHAASRLRERGVLLAVALAFCFGLAACADAIGLAPIVGAYAAGVILEDVHYKDLEDREARTLQSLVAPLVELLLPVFFVIMGLRTDLAAFVAPGVPLLALALTLVAVVGKIAAGLGASGIGGVPLSRLAVGVGMIPRGEVGLIFANVGLALTLRGAHIIEPQVFSALVVMVLVTTAVTPPLLSRLLPRAAGASPPS